MINSLIKDTDLVLFNDKISEYAGFDTDGGEPWDIPPPEQSFPPPLWFSPILLLKHTKNKIKNRNIKIRINNVIVRKSCK